MIYSCKTRLVLMKIRGQCGESKGGGVHVLYSIKSVICYCLFLFVSDPSIARPRKVTAEVQNLNVSKCQPVGIENQVSWF